jgi:hypothetical protein
MKKLNTLVYPLVVIASLVAAGSAFADDPTIDNSANAVSLKTRAQVQSELFAARADGSIKVSSIAYNPLLQAKSLKTRAEVKADVLAARGTGFGNVWYGEDSGSFALNRVQGVRNAMPTYAVLTK